MRDISAKIGRPRKVLLLVEMGRRFGRGILEGVARYRRENGCWSLAIDERGPAGGLVDWARRWEGDGILFRTQHRDTARDVARIGLPTVCLGEVLDSGFPTVRADDAAVGRLGAQHLKRLGLRHLGYVGLADVGCSSLREASFCETARRAGRPVAMQRIPGRGEHLVLENSVREEVCEWLKGLEKPCGVMAYDDLLAVRLTELCREVGLRIPSDVSVLGVGNDPVLCELSEPPLSSIENDLVGIGYGGARLLDSLMGGNGGEGRLMMVEPLRVVARASTDAAVCVDVQVGRALKFIGSCACEGIGVADVIRAAGGSRRQFGQTFRRLVGCGPKEAILRAQFKKVQEMLRTTDQKLSNIADECGFEHVEHMAAAFKRRFGVTPGEYRSKQQRGPASDLR